MPPAPEIDVEDGAGFVVFKRLEVDLDHDLAFALLADHARIRGSCPIPEQLRQCGVSSAGHPTGDLLRLPEPILFADNAR